MSNNMIYCDSFLGSARRLVKRCRPVVSLYHSMRQGMIFCLYVLSPVLLVKIRYRMAWGRWPDLRRPCSFDEKLLWLMLYWQHPLKTQCGDKYGMRSYVEGLGLGHVLPELIGVYKHSREIDFDALPNRFVLKCTHGCKFNIICKNKAHFDIEAARRNLDGWMKTDYSTQEGEIHYAKMVPRIICEPFLDDLSGDLPCDYKLYCFNGRVHCAMSCTGRTANEKANCDFYDREWSRKLPYSKTSLLADRCIPKPQAYGEMVAAAEVLSRSFPFVRMDFYNIQGKAVLGEMTFTPGGCINTDRTDIAQKTLGAKITLPAEVK